MSNDLSFFDGTEKLTCVVCGKALGNYAERGHQPSVGLAFITYGHYGSTYFDPMDGQYLELSICDPCVKKADEAGRVYHGQGRDPW